MRANEGTTVLHICFHRLSSIPMSQYSMQHHVVDLQRYRATSGERHFIEQIKAPISLEAVLATKIRDPIQF